MKNNYIVRGYLLSQHMLPIYKKSVNEKSLAISLAEVLLEGNYHYIIVTNAIDEEILEFKKELVSIK